MMANVAAQRFSATSLSSKSAGAATLRKTAPSRNLVSRRGGRAIVMNAAVIAVPPEFKSVKPTGDRVFVKVAASESVTKGGVLLPEQAAARPTSGDVVSLGEEAEMLSLGDTVLYSKFGIGTQDVQLGGELYTLIREQDVIGTMPNTAATAADIPEMKPLGDRVMIQLDKAEETTASGLILSEGSREQPIGGTVVSVGQGTKKEPMTVEVGQRVVYFKYAGDKMAAEDGTEYVVLHQRDCLGHM